MTDLLVFGAVVAVVLAAGIGLGMLVAPRLSRLAERDDEGPDDEGPEGSGDDERD